MRRTHNVILGALGVGLLVTALAAISTDVRNHVKRFAAGDTSQLILVTAPVNQAARVAYKTVNDYRTDEASMFYFGVAAIVLFGLLFKM